MDSDSLSFVAAEKNSGAHDLPPTDSDLASWLMMSGDLLGSSRAGMYISDFDPTLPPPPPSIGEEIMHSQPPHPHQEQHLHPHQQQSFHDSQMSQQQQQQYHHQQQQPPPVMNETTQQQEEQQQQQQQQQPQSKRGRPAKANNKRTTKTKTGKTSNANTPTSTPATSPKNATAKAKGKDAKKVLDPAKKREIRLEKNREIARNCRKRKREKYQRMEQELQQLRSKCAQLENQINQGRDGRDKEVARRTALQEMKAKLVSSSSSSSSKTTKDEKTSTMEEEIKNKLKEYKELYSDFGKERQTSIGFHLQQLKSLLLPNTVSKMTVWSLQQDDSFYDESQNARRFGGGIWNLLSSELQFTPEQKNGQ